MSSRAKLTGVLTALVTPMNRDGTIDYGALDALVDKQIEAGIDGLVPCGTTGESATMSADEREQVIAHVVKRANRRCTVVAGAGANGTAVAIEHQKRAAGTGADYALVVTPYYNKPTPTGLYKHYEALLGAADIPIILYNVPGRTACDMLPETVARLAEIPNIVGIKEATGSMERIHALKSGCPDDFTILSGEDFMGLDTILAGGKGVISVTANVAPALMHEMCSLGLAGETVRAKETDDRLQPLHKALFLESNPIPSKWALKEMGLLEKGIRLPLTWLSDSYHDEVRDAMTTANAVAA